MCLAIPVKIKEIKESNKALCDYFGVERGIDIRFTPLVKRGDYVLLHAGFSIQTISKKDALEVQGLLREIDG